MVGARRTQGVLGRVEGEKLGRSSEIGRNRALSFFFFFFSAFFAFYF
jgi:hypothetical protein